MMSTIVLSGLFWGPPVYGNPRVSQAGVYCKTFDCQPSEAPLTIIPQVTVVNIAIIVLLVTQEEVAVEEKAEVEP